MTQVYTNIEQSQKLAEILPLESADMFYRDNGTDVKLMWEHNAQKVKNPCWSLAALLNYLREIDFFPEIDADKSGVTMNINYYDGEDESLLVPIHNIKVKAESFIDDCVEMILKLHEEKII